MRENWVRATTMPSTRCSPAWSPTLRSQLSLPASYWNGPPRISRRFLQRDLNLQIPSAIRWPQSNYSLPTLTKTPVIAQRSIKSNFCGESKISSLSMEPKMNEMSYPAESIVGTVDGPDRDSYRNARMELKDLTEI